MRKIFTVLLIVAMVFALGACTSTTNPDNNLGTTEEEGTASTDTGLTSKGNTTTGTIADNMVTKEGFTVKLADNDEAKKYTRIYEINKLTGSDQLIFFGESNMTNFKVTSGTYENGVFTDTAVVHEENLVMPGEAVLLKTTLPANGGNIKISFKNSDGKVMNYVITRTNGKLDAIAL